MCLVGVDDNTNKGNTLGIESIQFPASLKQSVDFKNAERERGHSESNPCGRTWSLSNTPPSPLPLSFSVSPLPLSFSVSMEGGIFIKSQ